MVKDTEKNIIIIGGGPAGMMAAITAAKDGRSVVVLEHMEQCGKKILATGNGRCNFTNKKLDKSCYPSNPDFAMEVIRQFDNEALISFFQKLGIPPKNKNDFIYPYSEQASAIAQVLIERMKALPVEVITSVTINAVKKMQNGYKIQTNRQTFFADKVIVAAGLKASPKTGSDGSGYELLKELGVRMVKPLPALTALRSADTVFKSLAGIRCEAAVSVLEGDRVIASDTGELQLTDYGISGIPVFQISSRAVRLIEQKKTAVCSIDFVPMLSLEEFQTYILERIEFDGNQKLYNLFTGLLNSKLTDVLTTRFGLRKDIAVKSLTKAEITRLSTAYKNFKVVVNGYNSFDYAQVCQGGVAVSEICPQTMELHGFPGLYVAGEIVDVDGKCGGYNLQWAFSSGYVAGGAAAHDSN
jgi:hypothetical protein